MARSARPPHPDDVLALLREHAKDRAVAERAAQERERELDEQLVELARTAMAARLTSEEVARAAGVSRSTLWRIRRAVAPARTTRGGGRGAKRSSSSTGSRH